LTERREKFRNQLEEIKTEFEAAKKQQELEKKANEEQLHQLQMEAKHLTERRQQLVVQNEDTAQLLQSEERRERMLGESMQALSEQLGGLESDKETLEEQTAVKKEENDRRRKEILRLKGEIPSLEQERKTVESYVHNLHRQIRIQTDIAKDLKEESDSLEMEERVLTDEVKRKRAQVERERARNTTQLKLLYEENKRLKALELSWIRRVEGHQSNFQNLRQLWIDCEFLRRELVRFFNEPSTDPYVRLRETFRK
jgi:chromosome segregation ATPase